MGRRELKFEKVTDVGKMECENRVADLNFEVSVVR